MKLQWYEFLTVVIIIALDAITKTLSSTLLAYGQRVEIIKDFFWLTNVHNTGAAWSLFAGQRTFFIVVSIVALIMMMVFFIKSEAKQHLYRLALMILFAGTMGNFMDRLLLGYVRDFLSFNTFGYMFPVFNIADMALNVGVGLMILEALLEGKKQHGNT
jgi:signal peptidase II